ncbi:MAG: TraB/GumN family protein [Candidatus Krumholzibacteriota bacterium]|nr:TraB/GumN family protein [Candidatus Krumholzibacteriota bacterium]
MKRVLAVFLLLLLVPSVLFSGSMVWKAVSKNGSTVYIGGTVHLLRESDYPLPEEYEKAYIDSDILVLETDLDAMNDPDIQQMILVKGLYEEGKSLDSVLSKEAYGLLNDYCESIGIPLATFHQFRPSLVSIALLGIELQRLGIVQAGIDLFYHKRAKADGKEVKGLESIDKQIDYLLSIGEGNEDEFVIHTVKELRETGETIDGLIESWKNGDEVKMYQYMVESIRDAYPELFDRLIFERNGNWVPQIEAFFDSGEKEFVLMGAAHLLGDDGIIEQLRGLGYSVEKSAGE